MSPHWKRCQPRSRAIIVIVYCWNFWLFVVILNYVITLCLCVLYSWHLMDSSSTQPIAQPPNIPTGYGPRLVALRPLPRVWWTCCTGFGKWHTVGKLQPCKGLGNHGISCMRDWILQNHVREMAITQNHISSPHTFSPCQTSRNSMTSTTSIGAA